MRSWRRRAVIAVVACLPWLVAAAAFARSGGSGGGFHSSGGGGGGFHSSGGGGHFGGGSYSSGGGGNTSPEAIAVLFAFWVIVMIVVAVKNAAQRSANEGRQRLSVGRVQLGFAALRTKGLRDGIEAAVRESDPSTALGVYRLSQRVLDKVAAQTDAVQYAGFYEKHDLRPSAGEGEFQRLATDARAFFDREVVRKGADGLVESERNSKKATELLDEDGDFGIDELFVVTLIMAVRQGPIGLPAKLGPTSDVALAVGAMQGINGSRCVGFEVVWTPAAESDILTRDELLTAFPELAPV